MGLLLILALITVWHGLARVCSIIFMKNWRFLSPAHTIDCHGMVAIICVVLFPVVLVSKKIDWQAVWHWLVYMR